MTGGATAPVKVSGASTGGGFAEVAILELNCLLVVEGEAYLSLLSIEKAKAGPCELILPIGDLGAQGSPLKVPGLS